MHIRILGLGPRIHLLSFFDFERAVASGEVEPGEYEHWDEWSARSFLRRHFRDSYEIDALRQALAPDVYGLARLCDDAVLDIAVGCLRDGAWRVGYERVLRPIAGGGVSARASTAARAPARRSVPAPTPRSQPAPPRAAPVRMPAVATPAEHEWTDDTDQATFADVLERSAADATPFCEVCAALRAQQAAVPA